MLGDICSQPRSFNNQPGLHSHVNDIVIEVLSHTIINIMVGKLIPSKTIDYEFMIQYLSAKLRVT